VPCNVAEEASVEALVDGVVDRQGRLDVLVNNAGITRDGMMHKLSLEDFRAVVDVHLQGTWLCSRAALTHMRSRDGGGAIVNMSSISGKVGNLGQSNYAAAKAGIVGMTKATAREGARFGIRANAIQPGLINTAMTQAMPEDVFAQKAADIPLGRAGEPSEIADAALFLASDMASYVTGVTLEVAGGRHM
jgi:3-oxoacyl-[acyl-carrier protein] reductase